jgi:hypothetical protein
MGYAPDFTTTALAAIAMLVSGIVCYVAVINLSIVVDNLLQQYLAPKRPTAVAPAAQPHDNTPDQLRTLAEWCFKDMPDPATRVLYSTLLPRPGVPHHTAYVALIHFARRCAFEGGTLRDLTRSQSDTFFGPVFTTLDKTLEDVAEHFAKEWHLVSALQLMMFMQTAQILGAYHPEEPIRKFWNRLYRQQATTLNLFPESTAQLEGRLETSAS